MPDYVFSTTPVAQNPVRCVNLSTGEELLYHLPPREAVLCAFAQFPEGLAPQRRTESIRGERRSVLRSRDGQTWLYEERYGHRVEEGLRSVACGDWCALKEATAEEIADVVLLAGAAA